MKSAAKTWYLYVIGFVSAFLIIVVPFIIYISIHNLSTFPREYLTYIYLFAAVVIFGVTFIVQDLYRARIRHKTKNWVDKLPEQNLATAWTIFYPGILCSGTLLIAGGISEILRMIWGPLLVSVA